MFLLVPLFQPFTAGLYWNKASRTGALWSIWWGMAAYLLLGFYDLDIPAHLAALTVSAAGMITGSIMFPTLQNHDKLS
jgi:Na+/pantothenate symporter